MRRIIICLILLGLLSACTTAPIPPTSTPIPSEENLLAPYEYATTEISLENNGMKIYGVAYIPLTGEEQLPLVIFSHGLGGNYSNHFDYAGALAIQGIASYSFDFCGGGGAHSDGSMLDMSVMTEVSDLEVVLEAARDWDFVDADKIVLVGTSQGGYVSAVVAARHPDEVAGLVINCPAFSIAEILHNQYGSLDNIGDTFFLIGAQLGRIYAEDIWDYDAYSEIGLFEKKVLIQHGELDNVVDIAYSRRAVEVYTDAELIMFSGAGHLFFGADASRAIENVCNYLRETKILQGEENTPVLPASGPLFSMSIIAGYSIFLRISSVGRTVFFYRIHNALKEALKSQ